MSKIFRARSLLEISSPTPEFRFAVDESLRALLLTCAVISTLGCTEKVDYYYVRLEAPTAKVTESAFPKRYEHVISLHDYELMPTAYSLDGGSFYVLVANPLDDHVAMLDFAAVDLAGHPLIVEGRVKHPCIGRFRQETRPPTPGDDSSLSTSFELAQPYVENCTPKPLTPGIQVPIELLVYEMDGQYKGRQDTVLRVETNGYMRVGEI